MIPQFVHLLLAFLGAALTLYVVMGGADYGAGILELLPNKTYRAAQKQLINHAMGPVWEANHMWLIIVIVILFVAFPPVYAIIMTSLHLPVVALLVGIVTRGTIFTFRHYDAIQGRRSQKIYTALFASSSLWSSMWIGVIASSMHRGKIDLETRNFWEAYVTPWIGFFPLAMGVFVSNIFAFLASIFLVGETDDEALKSFFFRRAFILNALVVISGALVFFTAEQESYPIAQKFLRNKSALGCFFGAGVLFVLLWFAAKQHQTTWVRLTAAGQAALILFGWYALQTPYALATRQGPISFVVSASPESTLRQLLLALCVGSTLIFPGLAVLLHLFKIKKAHESGESLTH